MFRVSGANRRNRGAKQVAWQTGVLELLLIVGLICAAAAPVLAGTVRAWGNNVYGQLGNGTTTNSSVPVEVSGLSNVRAVAGGVEHSLALKTDGTVWAWGANSGGELGNGTTVSSNVPVEVSGLSDATAVAGGGGYSLALNADGTVWAWGGNKYGVLGDGTTISSSVPVNVSELSNVTAIAGALSRSLALKSDGTVWAWGYYADGEPGNAMYDSSSVPVEVSGLSDVTAIAVGWDHSLALKSDGTVWAWGYNSAGQFGDGTYDDSSNLPVKVPVEVSGLSNVTAIAAGAFYSLALKTDGTVWAWGLNNEGELGDGTTAGSNVPVEVSSLSNVTAIAAGGGSSLALKTDGTVWAWGDNFLGELGNGTTNNGSTPVEVMGLPGIAAIATGGGHILAVVDMTAPTTTVSLSGPAGQNGWYTGPVTVTLAATDPDNPSSSLVTHYTLDGGAQQTYTQPFTITADGTHTIQYWSVDVAGNVETAHNQKALVDTSLPAITITAPANQTSYTLNQVVNASYSAVDNADGIVSVTGTVPSGSSIDTASVGTKTFTVKASDTAGNSSQASVSYTVSYGVKLLYEPTIAAAPGQPLAISLQLVDASGANVSSANIPVQAVSITGMDEPASPGTGTGPAFTFDPMLEHTGGYVFNLSTKDLPAGSLNLNFIAGNDPTVHQAPFTSAGPAATVPKGISMVSVPLANSGDLASFFGVQVLPNGSADIATYDPVSNQYLLYPHLPGTGGKSGLPGRGYWVEESSPTKVQSTASANPSPLDVTLSPGWNMIGDPYPFPMTVASLQVIASAPVGGIAAGTPASFSAAITAGLVGDTVWAWDNTGGQYAAATTLGPFGGYWVYVAPAAGQGLTLRFTNPGFNPVPQPAG